MYILDKTWTDDYLDFHMSRQDVQVSVQAYWPIHRLKSMFFEQPRSLWKLWNYLREVGPVSLARKVRSRWAERLRNTRFLSIGLGTIRSVGSSVQQVQPGQTVIFLAPCHPRCLERVVVPPELVAPAAQDLVDRLTQPAGLLLFDALPSPELDSRMLSLAGWNCFSGHPLPPTAPLMQRVGQMLASLDPQQATVLPLTRPSPAREISAPPQIRPGLNAVIFGLGNYAKTCLLPNIERRIHVARIHEIDSTQIGRLRHAGHAFDTCPTPRPDEKYDVYFIASYHHTHAPLAVHALRQGAWAVIEKPLVTTREQFAQLRQAMREHPGRVFAGYHKQYNPLVTMAREDLDARGGRPVNCNCIVFEMPLPTLHWYRWPNSCSRLVSNGCHWLDLFLHMNDYCPPVRSRVWLARNGDTHVSVELANNAAFSMVLTEIGSQRLGVQDTIEMRSGQTTVRLVNDGRYFSENNTRILRRKYINKTVLFRNLYSTVCQRILANQPGDSLESIERTHGLMLDLEEAASEAAGRPAEQEVVARL